MDDDEFKDLWSEAEGGHGRLKWARMFWQRKANAINATPTDAARSIGWKPNTYLAYERLPTSSKHIALDHQAAMELGRRFRVNWRWLLLNEGTPFDDILPEPQARVVQVMSQASETDQVALAAMVEAFFRARKAS